MMYNDGRGTVCKAHADEVGINTMACDVQEVEDGTCDLCEFIERLEAGAEKRTLREVGI